ncbi:MAG TPA: putative zinc-binding peptidase [Polyangiales bacterium]|nr:putative zinc-binding peptidase [Polyangiales bacterium]
MRAFACSHCGQLLFFENSHCLRCGAGLGFEPEQLELKVIEPRSHGRYRLSEGGRARYKRCARTHLASCNWLLDADDPEELCRACRLTPHAPPLRQDDQLRAFAQAESNKRRLMYQLYDLGLPVLTREEDPKRGLEFVLAFRSDEEPVMTGHLDGVITLDLSECDDVHRERMRHEFGEPYRTLLGHFRHEIGHYYWNVLIEGRAVRERFRTLFGDETIDYGEALRRNYEDPVHYWSQRHVSAYASSHPWEDWAETFAHYLHIRDTLQTAANFGLRVTPAAQTIPPAGGKLSARASEDVMRGDFDAVVAEWLPLTYAFNAANRSMGKEDLYPFVLAPAVIEKLSFVHELVRDVQLGVELLDVSEELPDEADEAEAASAA